MLGFLQGLRARLPGKAAGQGCRTRLTGKAAGQGCRVRLPSKAVGQGCNMVQYAKSMVKMDNNAGSHFFFIVAFLSIKTELPDTTNLGKIQIRTI
jgi:hypothetical protein